MNQHTSSNPDPNPKDARKVTEDQRAEQDQLDHQRDDPWGTDQSWHCWQSVSS